MNEEAKKAAREYMRKWRRENKDKVKQYNERYWAKKAREANGQDEQREGSKV